MKKFYDFIVTGVLVLAFVGAIGFLLLALLEPIYTTPLSDWTPLLLISLGIAIALTIFAIKTGEVEKATKRILAAFFERLVTVIVIVIAVLLIISFFGWNGGAPVDDIDGITPADIDFP